MPEIYRITDGDGRLLDVVVTENGALGALDSYAQRMSYCGYSASPDCLAEVTIMDDGMTLGAPFENLWIEASLA